MKLKRKSLNILSRILIQLKNHRLDVEDLEEEEE